MLLVFLKRNRMRSFQMLSVGLHSKTGSRKNHLEPNQHMYWENVFLTYPILPFSLSWNIKILSLTTLSP